MKRRERAARRHRKQERRRSRVTAANDGQDEPQDPRVVRDDRRTDETLEVIYADFEAALKVTSPSISATEVAITREWRRR